MTDSSRVRESHVRSLMKGFTWRVVATATTILIAWLVTNDITMALEIGLIEVFAKIVVYYFHERAWLHVRIGTDLAGNGDAPGS